MKINSLETTLGVVMDILRTHNMIPQCPMEPILSPHTIEKTKMEVECPPAPMKLNRQEALEKAKQRALEKTRAKQVQSEICTANSDEMDHIVVPSVQRITNYSSESPSDCESEDSKKGYKKIPGKFCCARIEGETVEIPGTKSSRSGKAIQAYKPKECSRAAAFVVKLGEDEDDICYLCAVCHTRHSEAKDTWMGFFDDGAIPSKSHLMGSVWYKAMLTEGMKKLACETKEEE